MAGSFGDLLKGAGLKVSEAAAEVAEATPEPVEADGPSYGPKVVVRLQRKGQGGKTVTSVSGVLTGREELAKTLRKQLGTGTRIEGEELILQGDQRERAARWFESQGVKKVVRS